MDTQTYTVTVRWDAEARVWYVDDSDVPGLATEADTLEQMEGKLAVMIPELLALNEPAHQPRRVPYELIAHKQELSA
jgi:predicted RNase H-like HicB family nuclease